MEKFTNTLKLVGGALVALIMAPVVALFGLTLLGLAIGAAALTTGTIGAMVWQQTRKAQEAAAQMPGDAADAAPEAEASPTAQPA